MSMLEYYGHKGVKGYESKHGTDLTLPLPEQLVGLELEIEGFNPEASQSFGGFTFTADGSLRNYNGGIGIEAITKPVATKYVEGMLSSFFKKYEINEGNYSERCSTHVHFNVQPLNWDQLASICLLYQTLERVLFTYVGHDRDKGIFCVPWSQSNISCSIVNDLQKDNGSRVFKRWQKYSALNLIPVSTMGTIEFRHLHGTCDVTTIVNWIAILSCLFKHALDNPFENVKQSIINMNTVSNYSEWLNQIFGKYATLLQSETLTADLSIGVIDSKLMLMKPPEVKVPSYLARDQVNNLYRELLRDDAFRAHQPAQAAGQNVPQNFWNVPAAGAGYAAAVAGAANVIRGTRPVARTAVPTAAQMRDQMAAGWLDEPGDHNEEGSF